MFSTFSRIFFTTFEIKISTTDLQKCLTWNTSIVSYLTLKEKKSRLSTTYRKKDGFFNLLHFICVFNKRAKKMKNNIHKNKNSPVKKCLRVSN